MALTLKYNNEATSSSLDDLRIHTPKLAISARGPAVFTFQVDAVSHTRPIAFNDFVSFWDDAYSNSEPLFRGYVRKIDPGDNKPFEVNYTVMDPQSRISEEVFVRDGPYSLSTSVPRAVYNCKIDADDDRGFELLHDATVGEIIADILDNVAGRLNDFNLGDGTAGSCYVAADLTPLDYKPEEKITFDSESVISAVRRLLDYYPAYRMYYHPGTKKLRIYNAVTATQWTGTLNDFSDANKRILSCTINPVVERRYTAIKVMGKRELTNNEVKVSDGTLTELPEISGADIGYCRRWQVTDTAKRHMSRTLKANSVYTSGNPTSGAWITGHYKNFPVLAARWEHPAGEIWEEIPIYKFRFSEGIVESQHVLWKNIPEGSSTKVEPLDVKLLYAYYDAPLSVRYPTSGYSGTAYTVDGIEAELCMYNEMLNTGYEKWDTVTPVEKQDRFLKLCQNLHEAYSVQAWTGGMALEGAQYDFLRLQRRVNLGAIGNAGTSVTTGWESARMIVTDVEYDYSEGVALSTVTFSGDLSEFYHKSVDTLRRMLKIYARVKLIQKWRYTGTIDASGVLSQEMGWYVTERKGEF